MTAVTDPDLCKRVALRYSVGCIGICSVIAPALDLTTYAFALVSNIHLEAYPFPNIFNAPSKTYNYFLSCCTISQVIERMFKFILGYDTSKRVPHLFGMEILQGKQVESSIF